jgi:hypothetical protein
MEMRSRGPDATRLVALLSKESCKWSYKKAAGYSCHVHVSHNYCV